MCRGGALLFLPLFLPEAGHTSPDATGLLLLPTSLEVAIGSVAGGRLTASGSPRRPMLTGLALACRGAAVLGLAGRTTPPWVLIAGSVALGRCSLAKPAMTAVVVSAARPDRAGLASSLLNAARPAAHSGSRCRARSSPRAVAMRSHCGRR